jgi:hypothetical protein
MKHLPVFLITAYLIRLLAFGASLGDAIVMIVLGALYAGYVYLDHIKQPEANADLKTRLGELEKIQTLLKNKVDSFSLGFSLKK